MGGAFSVKRQQDISADFIRFLLANTQLVTDFSEGSIIRSLSEAISQEIYSSNLGFAQGIIESINTSIKEVFDQPLSQPQKASGKYTFYRKMLSSPQLINSISSIPKTASPYGTFPVNSTLYYGVAGYKKRSTGTDQSTKYTVEATPALFTFNETSAHGFTEIRWTRSADFSGYYIYRSNIDSQYLTENVFVLPDWATSGSEISVSSAISGFWGRYFFTFCGIDFDGKHSVSAIPIEKTLLGQIPTININKSNSVNVNSFKYFRNSVGGAYNLNASPVVISGLIGDMISSTESQSPYTSTVTLSGSGNSTTANLYSGMTLSLSNSTSFSAVISTISSLSSFTISSSYQISAQTDAELSAKIPSVNSWNQSHAQYAIRSMNAAGIYGVSTEATNPADISGLSTQSSKIIFGMSNDARYYEIHRWLGSGAYSQSSLSNKFVLDINPNGNEYVNISAFVKPIINSITPTQETTAISSKFTNGSTYYYKIAPIFSVARQGSASLSNTNVGSKIIGASSDSSSIAISQDNDIKVVYNIISFKWGNNFLKTNNSAYITPIIGIRIYRKKDSENWKYYDYFPVTPSLYLTTSDVSVIDNPDFYWFTEIGSTNSSLYKSLGVGQTENVTPYPVIEFLDKNQTGWNASSWLPPNMYTMANSVSYSSDSSVFTIQPSTSIDANQLPCPFVYLIADIPLDTSINSLEDNFITASVQPSNKSGSSGITTVSASSEVISWQDYGYIPSASGGYSAALWPKTNTAQAIEGQIIIPRGVRVSVPNTTKVYETTESITLDESQNSGTASIVALQSGKFANTAENSISFLSTNVFGIDYGTNPTAITSGKDLETEYEWRSRFSKTLRQLSRGTKESLEEGAKQASVTDVNGNIIEEVKSSYAHEEANTAMKLYIHNGTGSQVSSALLDSCQKIINGYESFGVIYPGYKPAGIPVVVSQSLFYDINIYVQLLIGAGINLSIVRPSVQSAIEEYIQTISISDGFDQPNITGVSLLNPNSSIPLDLVNGKTIQYKIVLADKRYTKGIPSESYSIAGINSLTPQSLKIDWSVTSSTAANVSYAEILRWNNFAEEWKLIGTKTAEGSNWQTFNDLFTETEKSYIFDTTSRNVLQKSGLISSIMKVSGILSATVKIFSLSDLSTEKQIVVPPTGSVVRINYLEIR